MKENKILALAHTVASTEEIAKRIGDVGIVDTFTIHTFCRKLISEHGRNLPVNPIQYLIDAPWVINPEFTILANTDADDFEKIIGILKTLDCKNVFNEDELIKAYNSYVTAIQKDIPVELSLKKDLYFKCDDALALLERFEQYKRDNHVLEHHDCLIWVLAMAIEHPRALQQALGSYEYLFLDEFQDNNGHQYALIKHMIECVPHTIIVGDSAQGIFLYSGAIKFIFPELTQQFPNMKKYQLVNNHRSTTEILALANHVRKQLGETNFIELVSEQKLSGPKPQVVGLKSMKLFTWLIDEIQAVLQSGVKPSEIAILCRSTKDGSKDVKTIVKALSELKIKYSIRPKTQKVFGQYHKFFLYSLWFIDHIGVVPNLNKLIKLMFNLEKDEAKTIASQLLIDNACEDASITQFYTSLCSIEQLNFKERISALRKLYNSYSTEKIPVHYKSFQLWLYLRYQAVKSFKEAEESYYYFFYKESGKMSISTVHSFKGSEAKVVFFIGVDAVKYSDNIASKVANTRVVYTGITRAMQMLYLVYEEKVASKYPTRLTTCLKEAVEENLVDFKIF